VTSLQRLRHDRHVIGAAQTLLIAVWPVVAIAASYRAVTSVLGIRRLGIELPISAVLFAGIVFTVTFLPPRLALTTAALKSTAIEIFWGFVAFELLILIVTKANTLAVLVSVSFIYVAAGSEEIVFRVLLPNQLEQRLIYYNFTRRHAMIAACIVSQCVFALCHFAVDPRLFFGNRIIEFIRLFAAGLLYAEIVAVVGVGSAAVVHTLVNFLLRTTTPSPMHPGLPIVVAILAMGLVHLWFRISIPNIASGSSLDLIRPNTI